MTRHDATPLEDRYRSSFTMADDDLAGLPMRPPAIPYTSVGGGWGAASTVFVVQMDVGRRWVGVHGELDLATGPQLAAATALLVYAAGTDCTVDLTGLRFIDATGIGALVGLAAELAQTGATLTLNGARPRVRYTFGLVDLTAMLEPAA